MLNSAVSQYAPRTGSVAKSQARALAIEAFQSYDPKKAKLSTHLYSRLQRLRRYATTKAPIVQIPEKLRAEQQYLQEQIKQFEDDHGRPPSDLELSDRTGFSLRKLQRIRQIPTAVSATVATSPDSADMAAGVALENPSKDQFWVELVYHDLTPTDQFIMERLMGLHGHKPMPSAEIAKQLRLSPAAVSPRVARIQSLLNKQTELGF